MRDPDFDKIDCMEFVREHGNVTLRQSKDIVRLSPAWADCYDADQAPSEASEQAVEIDREEERTAA